MNNIWHLFVLVFGGKLFRLLLCYLRLIIVISSQRDQLFSLRFLLLFIIGWLMISAHHRSNVESIRLLRGWGKHSTINSQMNEAEAFAHRNRNSATAKSIFHRSSPASSSLRSIHRFIFHRKPAAHCVQRIAYAKINKFICTIGTVLCCDFI